MAASTVDRNTPVLYSWRQTVVPLAAAAVIPAGVMVAEDADGKAVNAANTVGLRVIGRAEHAADQTKGDTEITVGRGVYGFAMSAGLLAVAQATTDRRVYVVDNQTVGLASDASNLVVAGYLEMIAGNVAFVALGMFSNSLGADGDEVANGSPYGGAEIVIPYLIADAATGDIDITMKRKIEVIDVTCIKSNGAGAGNTMQLKKGAAVISNAIACDTDNAVTRAGSIDDANATLAVNDILRVTATRAAGTRDARVFVKCLFRA